MKVSRAQLATIHIAKKDRGLDDDAYRDFLWREAGVRSAADLDERGAARLILAFKREGFEPPSKPSRALADRRPIVRKATAMWIALHNLDEVANASDRALDAFAAPITGKERLRFATNGEAGKVVEALKAWTERVGVSPDTTHALIDPLRSLVGEQARRLGLAGADIVQHRAGSIAARQVLDHGELQALANELGREVRRRRLGRRHQFPSSTQGAGNAQQQSRPDQR